MLEKKKKKYKVKNKNSLLGGTELTTSNFNHSGDALSQAVRYVVNEIYHWLLSRLVAVVRCLARASRVVDMTHGVQHVVSARALTGRMASLVVALVRPPSVAGSNLGS